MNLDQSYFVGPLTLAQLGQKAVNDNLISFIDRLELEALQAALGYDLAQAYIDAISAGSGDSIDQKWLDLSNGIVFSTASGIKKKWVGFYPEIKYLSPLAGIVYAEYMRDQATQVTGSGVKNSQAENADAANPAYKICEAFNKACRDIHLLWEFLNENKETYTEYEYRQIDHCYFKQQNPFGI